MNFWQKWNNRIGYIGLVLGILFLGIGIVRDETSDIYRKAVMICLECIGIG